MKEYRPIGELLQEVTERIARACRGAGRSPDAVEIVAVSKTHGPEVVREACAAGLRLFGENRVQEAAWKIPQCPGTLQWHLIGHLQRNKVRAALEYFAVIHSVDSLKLLEQIERIADECGKRTELLLEVNVSGESSKQGFKPEEVPAALEYALNSASLNITGLMTMAPFTPKPEETRPVFAALRQARDRWEEEFGIGLPNLSMGMSNDYEIAVSEGATWLRIGTTLFGERPRWRPQADATIHWEP